MEARTQKQDEKVVAARRRFLANCGKFAVITPPVVSLMLAASQRNYAAAYSCNYSRNDGEPGRAGESKVASSDTGRSHS